MIRPALGWATPIFVVGSIAFLFTYPLLRLLALPLLIHVPAIGGWRSVWNALALALITAAVAAPLGATLAIFISRYLGGVAMLTRLTLWGLFLAPSYVLTTGWMIVFETHGLRTTALGNAFFGIPGLLLLFVLKALPFSAFVARATLSGAGASLGEAALVHGLAWHRRQTILLRLIAPALATAFAVAVIETMQEFGIPATLGTTSHVPLLTYAIYQRLAETPTDFAGAALLCWRLVGIAGILAIFSLSVQRRDTAMRGGRSRPTLRIQPERATAFGIALVLGLILCLGFVIPAIALIVRALGHAMVFSGTPHIAAVPRSLGFGLVGGTLALAVAIVLLKLRNGAARTLAALIDVLLLANMAVPGLVLAAGYIVAFNNDLLPLYGTTALLIIAYAAGTIPLTLRMIEGALGDLDRNLGAAARLHGLSRATRTIDIEAALLAEPLLYGLLVSAGAIMFELPISELLYPPGATPLGVAIVGLDQMGDFGAAARLALLGLVAMAVLAAVLIALVKLVAAPREVAPA